MNSAQSAHILLVEDDHQVSEKLSQALRNQGYQTTARADGNSALYAAMQGRFELILLDIMLPRMNGFSLLKQLRNSQSPPVIMLNDHSVATNCKKCCNINEVVQKIDSVLRKSTPPTESSQPDQCQFEQLSLDKAAKTAHFNQQQLPLTPMEFSLLWFFLQHPSETLTKEHLYQSLLKRDYNRHDRSLDMHISNLRKKLELAGFSACERLKTIRGLGYRFH